MRSDVSSRLFKQILLVEEVEVADKNVNFDISGNRPTKQTGDQPLTDTLDAEEINIAQSDNEIDDLIAKLANTEYDNRIGMNKTNNVEEEINVDDENDETDFSFDTRMDDYIPNDAVDENSDSELNDNERPDDMNGDVENHVGPPFSELKINLGTNELPRFSCACHKSNIAVRHAIASNQHFTAIASKLSRHSSTVKRTLHLVRTHLGRRAKLQINNVTRWSSVYMMLLSYQKAYKKIVLLSIHVQSRKMKSKHICKSWFPLFRSL
jgi:hypothetical protein